MSGLTKAMSFPKEATKGETVGVDTERTKELSQVISFEDCFACDASQLYQQSSEFPTPVSSTPTELVLDDPAQSCLPNDLVLDLVSLARCYAGHLCQALVNAGVHHVVCCYSNEKVLDQVALDFEKSFYKYLVSERFNLEDAFGMACFETTEKYGKEHGNKFCLLPNGVNDPGRHSVPIFVSDVGDRKCQLVCLLNSLQHK